MRTLAERFQGKYLIDPATRCWNWTRARNPEGYGEIKAEHGNRNYKAHRVSFELHKGPIPAGLVVDHVCRNTSCVNPEHLRAISKYENTMIGFGNRAIYARRTACDNGHPFTDDNTIIRANGARRCRTCKNIRERDRKRRARAWQRKAGNG